LFILQRLALVCTVLYIEVEIVPLREHSLLLFRKTKLQMLLSGMMEIRCRGHIRHTAPLQEHCHNSKNTTFQERGKTTGQGDAIASKEQRRFSPLAAILENRRVTLFH
jgi:hypothetical protein